MKKIPLKIMIILLFLQFKLNAQENQIKPSLHLILCGTELEKPFNHGSFSSALYSSTQKDLWNMRISFFIIAYQLGMQFDCVDYKTALNKLNFTSFFDKLEIKPDDITIFYFSGIGFRTKETQNEFPMITRSMSLHSNINKEAIELMDIKKIIDAKSLNKSFIITDCCNFNNEASLVQEDHNAYSDTALIDSLKKEIQKNKDYDTLNSIYEGFAERTAILAIKLSESYRYKEQNCQNEINISKTFLDASTCIMNEANWRLRQLFLNGSMIVSSAVSGSGSYFNENGGKFTELFCQELIDYNYNNWVSFFNHINDKIPDQKCIFSVKPN
jgi:hypothetical protein